jgi:hypothetical protein
MRYLNRQWVEGGYDEFTTQLYWGVYLRHLEDLAPDMPQWVRALGAMSLGKHFIGCPVSSCGLDAGAGVFHLVVEVETIEGDAFLDIKYQGVDPDSVDEHAFDDVEFLLTDELDIAPDEKFEHRILLSPEGEFAIQFKDLRLNLTQADEEE